MFYPTKNALTSGKNVCLLRSGAAIGLVVVLFVGRRLHEPGGVLDLDALLEVEDCVWVPDTPARAVPRVIPIAQPKPDRERARVRQCCSVPTACRSITVSPCGALCDWLSIVLDRWAPLCTSNDPTALYSRTAMDHRIGRVRSRCRQSQERLDASRKRLRRRPSHQIQTV